MRRSKYSSYFETLSKKPMFTSAEARKLGIPSRMLAYFCKRGVLEHLDRGVYQAKGTEIDINFEWEDFALTLMSIPEGIICLISALCYYNMTDQIMREFWIAVPHSSRSPKRPNTRIIRMRNTSLGQTTVCMGKYHFKIFDRERTVVDAFRYLSKEIAMKALLSYLKQTGKEKPNIKKLLAYAKELRVTIEPYIMALLT